jgi:hypothetical protein
MRAVQEIRTGIGVLVGVQLVVTFGVMGLLTRMAPAVEKVIDENVTSITAVEQMYASLAARDCGLSLAEAEARFDEGLAAARASAYLPGEAQLVDQIDKTWRTGLAGECDARLRTGALLSELADINRGEMEKADEQAKQLGGAGAWAATLLGLFSFAAGVALIRAYTRRFAEPMAEVEAVLAAVHRGDPYRRARRLDAPQEYGTIAMRLNQMLDRRLAREEGQDPRLAIVDRTLLHHLLDRLPEPMVAVDTSGAIIAASDRALDILAGAGVDSLSDVLKVGPGRADEEISLIQAVEPFGKSDGFLITLQPLKTQQELLGESRPSFLEEPPPEAPPAAAPPVTRRPTIDPLADRGGADEKRERPASPKPKIDVPDWERD